MQNKDGSFGSNKSEMFIATVTSIFSDKVTKRIIKNLPKDTVASEILKDIEGYNIFDRTDQGLLIF